VTQRSVAVGSPLYMSPEQLASPGDVDGRADIWALGITLFEMLVGSTPFRADATPLLCSKILRDPPQPIRELRPDVPEGIETIIGKCLEKEREKRYPNVGELAVALAPFGPERARGSAERVRRTAQAASPASRSDDGRLSPTSVRADGSHLTRVVWDRPSDGSPLRRRQLPWFAASVLVACGIAGAVVWRVVAHRDTTGDPAPTVEPTPAAASVSELVAPEPSAAVPVAAASAAQVPDRTSANSAPAARPPAKAPSAGKRAPRAPNTSSARAGSKTPTVFDERN